MLPAPRVRVAVTIPASRKRVWDELADLASYADWMDDAVNITFTSATREGVGTTFDCLTRVGPFTTRDRMRVTGWVEGRSIAVSHEGLVRGSGRFTVKARGRNRTKVVWRERLRFPWWLGGAPTAFFAGRVLRHVWRRDLRNLRDRLA